VSETAYVRRLANEPMQDLETAHFLFFVPSIARTITSICLSEPPLPPCLHLACRHHPVAPHHHFYFPVRTATATMPPPCLSPPPSCSSSAPVLGHHLSSAASCLCPSSVIRTGPQPLFLPWPRLPPDRLTPAAMAPSPTPMAMLPPTLLH
jgi:hypothetical protein